MTPVMMKCGHAANSRSGDKPACAICVLTDEGALIVDDTPPDLSTRQARCSCGKIEPSHSTRLAFFEYRGEGSPAAINSCKNCGFHEVAHDPVYTRERNVEPRTVVERGLCKGFEAKGPWQYDSFYCGCGGWD